MSVVGTKEQINQNRTKVTKGFPTGRDPQCCPIQRPGRCDAAGGLVCIADALRKPCCVEHEEVGKAFWIALLHDGIEDGWLPVGFVIWLPGWLSLSVTILTRWPDKSYFGYIATVDEMGGNTKRVKIANLTENMKRASPSLQKRYRKALGILNGQD